MPDELLVRAGSASRCVLQCADIILLEAATLARASWQLVSAFAGYPGCLVVAVRHECGQWALLAARGHDPRIVRPGFSGRISWQALGEHAREAHTRAVTS
ncbi:hypothetical protein L1857_07935 [Amycolatopsis thermalba]|uniref:Uncharacterized protein n=1 Tax=Amycolatopsis thermalba TaxID=944492 RepID=A0ABY4NRR3_9PSEU|nr:MULTISPECIES: hypothetical protein [Amycolatopsis]UQS22754.1 hypothetical protein L1857_07935 [Amycolatopsis thermalba]